MVEKIEGEISLRFTDDDIVSESKATSKAIGTMGDSIESDLDDISTSADKVQKEFEGVGKSAKSGGDKASKALDKTGEKAKKAAGKLKETGTAGKKAGDDVAAGADKGGRAMDNMATSANNADNSMETLSTSMIGLAQTATGVSDAIFGLAASLVGLEKTQFGIKGMEIAARRMEEDLVVAFQEGILTTRELNRLTEDLGLAYEGLSLEAKQAAADELALNGQLVTIAINTGAAIVQSAIMISTLITMRGVRAAVTTSTIADSAATTTNTAVTAGNITGRIASTAATTAHTVATVASTIATRAMTTAMLLSPLAPFAIAAIAAGAAFIALNDNIGGTRDRIEDLTGQKRGSIPTLGLSISGLGDTFEDTSEKAEDFMGQAQAIADSATSEGGFNPVIEDAAENIQLFNTVLNPEGTFALSTFGDSLNDVTEQLIPFANGIFDASGNLIDLSKHMSNNNVVLDAWGKAILDSSDKLATETNQLKSNTDALKENSKAAEENAKKNDELILSINQFFSANGTLNTITATSGIPTIQGLVTQEFFNALPAGTEGGFTPTSGPGISMSTLAEQAAATASKNSVEGILIVALRGGSLDRSQSNIAQSLPSGFFNDIFTANNNGLFPFSPANFLQQGGTYGELNEIAIQVILNEAIRIAVEAAAVIAARIESVSLLTTRLGLTTEETASFAQTEAALSGFIDPVLAANIGLTNQQIQDFLSTESGRNDLANLIGWSQREELLRVLV